MNLDPYDVLGIPSNSDWKTIKKAYKHMLNQTHPDKMGNAKYFMLVHEAFNHLQETRNHEKKYKNLPTEEVKYRNDMEDIPEPHKIKNFTNEKFNKYFEKNKIQEENYMNSGYGSKMTQSLNYQEDISELLKNKLKIPKQELVMYKEPEALNSSNIFDSCYELGKGKETDFSCRNGTDIMEAYCERPQLADTSHRYRDVNDIRNQRSSQNLIFNEEEKEYYRKKAEEKERLEQYRLQRQTQNDMNLHERYVELYRRLN
tara:strand:+ start:2895 stop:3668 length:774 start_codon:yes stop_codon:yes gene_type:complete